MTTKEMLEKYGITSVSQLETLLKRASTAYYTTGRTLMPDADFDVLLKVLAKRKPDSPVVSQVRAPVNARKTVAKLPYLMPSLDKKHYGEGTFAKWTAQNPGPYTIGLKLDGVSVEVSWESGEYHLFVGGDANTGFKADNLIPNLKLPRVPSGSGCVRAELIMSKTEFEASWSHKYKNARNLTSGIVNKTRGAHEAAPSIRVVVYDVQHKRMAHSAAMAYAKKLGFETVKLAKATTLTEEKLFTYLRKVEKSADYMIDGIVVTVDKPFALTARNPKMAIAFKAPSLGNFATTTVTKVEWRQSRTGKWIPRIWIEPVKLAGVTVTKASAFNAKFIIANKVNAGAVIEIVRSGEVIPDIQRVVKPARTASTPPKGTYRLEGVHYVIVGENNTTQVKAITHFLAEGLGVFGLAQGKVQKIYDAGFTTVEEILDMDENDFLGIDGFQKRTAESLYNSIQARAHLADPIKVMGAVTSMELVGERKLERLAKSYPEILDLKKARRISRAKLLTMFRENGFKTTAERAVDQFIEAANWVCTLPLKFVKRAAPASARLASHVVVFTGVRDKAIEEQIKSEGGTVGSGVNAKTTAVLTNDPSGSSDKLKKARSLNIPIMTLDQYRRKFKL